MTVDERRGYVKRMYGRYWARDRKGRSDLLDEMVEYTGLHRKSLIRLLHADSPERQPRKTKRKPTYGADVENVVRVVWESLDDICAERLTPAVLPIALHLAGFDELQLNAELEEKLGGISKSTVQRMIPRLPRRNWRLPRRGPEQANHMRKNVPMERLPWSLAEPGFFEIDLVHHCGERASGDYVHTLQMIDVATGWSERVALLGRSQYAMEKAFRRAMKRLPLEIKGLHPDNGSEFFNNHLVRIWGEEITGLQLTRSRPFEKNDNRFVEQKNDVQLFVRSSACVEGRNGHLAHYHHGLYRLSKRRLKALTAIADYYARRADGTTAGERFFGQKPADLFGWLLDRLDVPARPRSSRLKAAA